MSVRIRLQRFGKKDKPFFRIVAIEKTTKRNGKSLDLLGTYDPNLSSENLKINKEALDNWLKKGAQVSEAVKKLLSQEEK